MDWKKLLGSITASVDEELRLRNTYLEAENRILRQQIHGRILLSDSDRCVLAEIGKQLGKEALEEIATIAKSNTILAWYRKFIDQKGDTSKPYKSAGRPRIDQEIESLVVQMARENRSWGYDRIVGALANLGYTISDQTVGNILKRHGIPPAPERKTTMTWKEFIHIHMDVLMATDFFISEVRTWFTLVIASFLCVMHVGGRMRPVAVARAWLHARWRLLISPQRSDRYADVKEWRRSVIVNGLSWLLRRGECGRRPLHSVFAMHHRRECRHQGMGEVVLLPVIHHRLIRDGPMRGRHRLGERLKDDHREAA